MQTPTFISGQFVTASLLNAGQQLISTSLQDIAGGFFTFGLLNPSALQFTFNSSLSVNLNAPKPFKLLTSSGILASANGVTSGATSSQYTLDFSSFLPSSGSITAYIVASTLQIGQNPSVVLGPPLGHPDYNPANSPFSAYTNFQDSIAFTVTTTAPDNVTYYEVARTTLTAGQTSVNSLMYGGAPISRPLQTLIVYSGDPNGNVAGIQGSSTNQPSLVWDTTDEILWICVTTGSATSAVWTGCANLNGISNQTFLVATATPGTNEAIPINQADIRYAAISGSGSNKFNVATATQNSNAVPYSQLVSLLNSRSSPYDISGGSAGIFGPSQIVLYTVIARSWTCTAMYADLLTATTNTLIFNITVNGVLVGTINFAAGSTSGTIIFSSVSSFSATAGQILEVVAPSAADPTAAGLGFTFVGTVN